MIRHYFSFFLLFLSLSTTAQLPHLQKQGTATQLIINGKPFLMLGGELGNSSASDMAYMKPIWPKLRQRG